MAIHRPYLTSSLHFTPSAPLFSVDARLLWDRSKGACVQLADELVRVQLAAHGADGNLGSSNPTSLSDEVFFHFTDTFFLFDGAVTLVTALAQTPSGQSTQKYHQYVERAGWLLGQAARISCPRGEIARRALTVLLVLKRTSERSRGASTDTSETAAPGPRPNEAGKAHDVEPAPHASVGGAGEYSDAITAFSSSFTPGSGWQSSMRDMYSWNVHGDYPSVEATFNSQSNNGSHFDDFDSWGPFQLNMSPESGLSGDQLETTMQMLPFDMLQGVKFDATK